MVRAWLVLVCLQFASCTSVSRQPFWLQGRHVVHGRTLTPSELEHRYQQARATGHTKDTILYANRLLGAGGRLDSRELSHVRGLVDVAAPATLQRLWSRLDSRFVPAPTVAFRLALLHLHIGEAARALDFVGVIPKEHALSARGEQLRTQINRAKQVSARTVVVLLPLTGPHAAIGREIRVAIEVAAQSAGGARFVYLDTEGDARKARDMVGKAVAEWQPIAFLGPVGRLSSRSAAAQAVALGVPIALLTPHASGSVQAGVFRLWTSPAWEARQVVKLAIEWGYQRVAILAPRDDQGQLQTAAFRKAAALGGVRVVATGSYDPTSADLESDVRMFLGLTPATNLRLRRHLRRYGRKRGWRTFSPSVGFELLYIPDHYTRSALVASYLPVFNVETRTTDMQDPLRLRRKHGGRQPTVVQLVGGAGWHHPSLSPRGGAAVEGALVLDVFARGSQLDATDDASMFAQAFKRRMRRQPTSVAAQAFDAAKMVMGALARMRGRSGTARSIFRRELSRMQLIDGVCGAARMRDGEIVRDAMVFRVEAGEFVRYE